MRASLSLRALALAAAALGGVEGIDLAKLRQFGEMVCSPSPLYSK
jgi:hypothetical protein